MNRLKDVRNRRDDALARVGWDRLEVMLADYYRAQGWSVDHVGTGARRSWFDGGIDLKLRKEGQYVLVQSKHWNAKQVTHNAVHELLGIKVNEDANGAIVITSGEFTKAARQAATRQGHVQLIDGDTLRTMLGPQLETLAAAEPPALPSAAGNFRLTSHPQARDKTPSQRVALRVGVMLLVAFVLYLGLDAYLRRIGFLPHSIEIDLPQRILPAPLPKASTAPVRQPATTPAPEKSPRIEQGMTDAELEEWKRKNAESMRILEENDKRGQEQGDSEE